MDNRFRILYRMETELRGRRGKAWAGNGEPGVSVRAGTEEKPCAKSDCVMRSEERVAKHAEALPGKAAMAFHAPVPKTDTGG